MGGEKPRSAMICCADSICLPKRIGSFAKELSNIALLTKAKAKRQGSIIREKKRNTILLLLFRLKIYAVTYAIIIPIKLTIPSTVSDVAFITKTIISGTDMKYLPLEKNFFALQRYNYNTNKAISLNTLPQVYQKNSII